MPKSCGGQRGACTARRGGHAYIEQLLGLAAGVSQRLVGADVLVEADDGVLEADAVLVLGEPREHLVERGRLGLDGGGDGILHGARRVDDAMGGFEDCGGRVGELRGRRGHGVVGHDGGGCERTLAKEAVPSSGRELSKEGEEAGYGRQSCGENEGDENKESDGFDIGEGAWGVGAGDDDGGCVGFNA